MIGETDEVRIRLMRIIYRSISRLYILQFLGKRRKGHERFHLQRRVHSADHTHE